MSERVCQKTFCLQVKITTKWQNKVTELLQMFTLAYELTLIIASFCKFSQPASFTCSQCEDDHVNVPIHRQLGASLQYVKHGHVWFIMVKLKHTCESEVCSDLIRSSSFSRGSV